MEKYCQRVFSSRVKYITGVHFKFLSTLLTILWITAFGFRGFSRFF